MAGWISYTGSFDRVLMFEACQSQCRSYLVPLFGNEIVMLTVNTKIKWYHKLVDLLLFIYIYITGGLPVYICIYKTHMQHTHICCRNIKSRRKGGKNCSYVWRGNAAKNFYGQRANKNEWIIRTKSKLLDLYKQIVDIRSRYVG